MNHRTQLGLGCLWNNLPQIMVVKVEHSEMLFRLPKVLFSTAEVL